MGGRGAEGATHDVTEFEFWSRHLRKTLHRPPGDIAWKLQDRYKKGCPDVWYCLTGTQGWFEMKYHKAWPKGADTMVHVRVSVEQRRHLAQAYAARCDASVVLGVGREVFLLPYGCAVELTQAEIRAQAMWHGHLNTLAALRESLRNGVYFTGPVYLER